MIFSCDNGIIISRLRNRKISLWRTKDILSLTLFGSRRKRMQSYIWTDVMYKNVFSLPLPYPSIFFLSWIYWRGRGCKLQRIVYRTLRLTFTGFTGPPRWRRSSRLDCGSGDPGWFSAYPHHVWARMARRLKMSSDVPLSVSW